MPEAPSVDHPLVAVSDLAKTYRVYEKPWHRVVEAIARQRRHREFHALEGVSFDLDAGQGLAIVGQNGAGKSTLLKILAGVSTPTSGSVAVRGTVASILELGSGFHPEFTGRQNIRLNAAMHGLDARQVDAKTPEIIAFSELGEFIDQPVKVYSTGMRMRLGFAIAIQVDPQVLIIDEALSVGDGYFQKKCFDRLQQYVAAGGTLLFCSHAMFYVSVFCQRALWLRDGKVEALGPVDEVVRRYENFLLEKSAGDSADQAAKHQLTRDTERVGPARIVKARLNGAARPNEPVSFRYRALWRLDLEWECDNADRPFHLGVGIDRVDGVQVAAFSTFREGRPPISGQRSYRVSLELPELPFLKGEFSVYIFLLDEAGLHPYDVKLLDHAFTIEGDGYEVGLFKVPHLWEI